MSLLKYKLKNLLVVAFTTFFISSTYAAHVATKPLVVAKSHVIWTAVFSNFTPIQKNISEKFCQSHTPSVIVTTISQITSKKGVTGLNGVNIRYLSYHTIVKHNLYFNFVNAVVSGKNADGKTWSFPMKLYEQTLSPIGITNTVWSTPVCKGKFLGTPTIIS